MARSSGFRRQARGRSSGISRDWGVGPGGTAVTQLTGSGVSLLGSALSPQGSEITVMRTRGIFDAFLEGVPAADGGGYFGAVGIGKATLSAFTAGIGSLPTPITEADWDGWLWHSFFSLHVGDVTFAGTPGAQVTMEVDSKAMRKFDIQEVLYAAVEVVETGSAVLNMRFDSRMLLQDSGR